MRIYGLGFRVEGSVPTCKQMGVDAWNPSGLSALRVQGLHKCPGRSWSLRSGMEKPAELRTCFSSAVQTLTC